MAIFNLEKYSADPYSVSFFVAPVNILMCNASGSGLVGLNLINRLIGIAFFNTGKADEFWIKLTVQIT